MSEKREKHHKRQAIRRSWDSFWGKNRRSSLPVGVSTSTTTPDDYRGPRAAHLSVRSVSQVSTAEFSTGTTVLGDSPVLPSAVEADAPPESTKSSTKSTTKSTTESTENTISLWDNAYDKLKEKNGELVSNYEELLSRALVHDKSQPPSPELESEGGPCKNEIPQDNIAERREKLREIIEIGLKHMKDNKLSTTVLGHKIILDDALASTAKAVDWAAEYVNDAVQDVPYGPAVMAGISLLLPLLRNPAMVEEANREGLVYVTSQMKFYNAMETQLLMIHPATRSDLLERLEELYCLVIEFQMESVIRFYTKRTKNYLNAIVDCDHWEEKRSHIEMEEHSMQRKLETTLSIEKSRYLKELLQEAKESRQDLTKIVLSILDVTQRMERRLSTSEHRECVKELGASDPCDDKTRIEEQKGGLIWDEPTFKWILDNPDYQRWLESDQDHLFWIKGDPGKGKTMLMCGIINELIKSVREKGNVVYFFCQESDRRINSAASVARGLIYMLVKQQRAMFPHLQQPFRDSKRFDDANAWTALCKILKSILDDPNLDTTYIVIDGLDECVDNLNGLLDLIACSSCRNPKVKWIVSSRNWVHIKKKRNQAISPSVLSLDMNTQEVRNAVERFIKLRVQDLPFKESTRSIISHNLSERAEDTFLWAALVCLELENVKDLEAQEISSKFPNDLNSLYNLMVKRIDQLRPHRKGTCYQILSIVSLAYHPLTLSQLAILSDFESVIPDEGDIKDILEECGSFLAQHEERPVYFVHQTAKEFMLKERHDEMFETGEENRHHALFSQSMKAISTKLRRDVCDLKDPGYFIGEAELPKSSELAAVQYSCLYWVDHLIAGGPHEEDLEEGGLIEKFLRKDYLHWLEALSLLRSVSIGVLMMLKLESFLATLKISSSLIIRLRDACQFIQHHKSIIERSPLQVYASALVFSPVNSMIRREFAAEEPEWISEKPLMNDTWSNCLLTLEGHDGSVQSVAWGPNGQVVSACYDGTARLWDPSTGLCTRIFKSDGVPISSVKWKSNNMLATVSADGTIRLWNTLGQCVLTRKSGNILEPTFKNFPTLNGKRVVKMERRLQVCNLKESLESFVSTAWSDDDQLAMAGMNGSVHVWKYIRDAHSLELAGHQSPVYSMAWSRRGLLATADNTGVIKIWNLSNPLPVQTIFAHQKLVYAVAWSHDGSRLASVSTDSTIKVWSIKTGLCTATLDGQSTWIRALAWSADGRLASADDETINIWDPVTSECLSRLEGHGHQVWSLSWSADSTRLISASRDKSIKIWDVTRREDSFVPQGHSRAVNVVVWSANRTKLASASEDHTIKVWEASSGQCLWTLADHTEGVVSVAWSEDGSKLASGSKDKLVKIWDMAKGSCIASLEGHADVVRSVSWRKDGMKLASASEDHTISIWNTDGGEPSLVLRGHKDCVGSLSWTEDGTRLASASRDGTIKIWETTEGSCISDLPSESFFIRPVTWSKDGTLVSTSDFHKSIQIRDVADKSKVLPSLNFRREVFWSQLDETEPYHLHTDIGTFDLNPAHHSENSVSGSESIVPMGYGIDDTGLWITFRGEKRLRLPSEYKIGCSTILPGQIGIGCGSGRVLIFGVSETS